MRITNTLSRADQKKQYVEMLRKRAAGNGFWQRRCANWWACGSNSVQFAVVDSYYTTPMDAHTDEVEWHLFLCKGCMNSSLWKGSEVLAVRPVMSLVKRIRCQHGTEVRCDHSTRMFIIANGQRRYLCITHVAIHSNYTQVWCVQSNGELHDMTEHAAMYYEDAIRDRIVGGAASE